MRTKHEKAEICRINFLLDEKTKEWGLYLIPGKAINHMANIMRSPTRNHTGCTFGVLAFLWGD